MPDTATPVRRPGGFRMPKNAGAALQEAIAEERRGEQVAEPEDNAHLRIAASAQVSTSAREDASKSVREEVSASVPAPASAEEKDLVVRVREALAAKRTHTGGTKASVDMSPELSRRVKRYCLDKEVPSSRVLMLELLTAFMDEEGY